MSADNRTVTTDALETLGTVIDASQKRDAIHLAVEPVIALDDFWPGDDVALGPNGGACKVGKHVGIVDPFLKERVKRGERFWLVVYPRQIKSLRHVWTHPDFTDTHDVAPETSQQATDPVAESRAWIERFASNIDQTYSRLMNAAETWLEYDDYTSDNSEAYKDHWDKFPEFWKHYAVVTGKEVPESKRDSFFTCSC